MQIPRSQKLLSGAVSLAFAVSAATATAQQIHPLSTHVPQIIRNGQASLVGSADSTRHLQLALSLPLRNEAQLDALLKQIYDPTSPNYHHYLTSAQFTASYAPTQQDYDTVVRWAQAKGLKVTRTTDNRRVVDVDGSIDTIDRAFNVLLNTYQDSTTQRTFHAPDREPTLDLSVPLLGISGMDDATPPRPHYRKGNAPTTNASSTISAEAIAHITGSGPGNTYKPSDMRAAYYGSGPLTGAGQTVAIFSYDGYITSDLSLYYSTVGMTSSVPVNNVLVAGYNGACFGFNANGTVNNNTCDDGEQILDIVNVIGMAPGLSQVLFYEGNSSTDVLNQMATDNVAKVISSSWGGGDFGTVSDPIFKQFQAQGQSYLNATGDSGQFNSSTYDPPSVDANITQVGGTDLVTNGAGGSWQSETGWADSGGGYVSGTAIPTYQQLAGVINSSNKGSTTLRNAPDVAAEANFDNTTVIDGSFESGYGGTSYATPRWAGLIALANQQAVANGKSTLGFLNPSIYNIGVGSSFAADFHDIVSGNNKPSAGSGSGFNAVAGYDLVTGWGSPNGPALIATLAGGATTTPDFTLSASPASLSIVAGANGTSTISVAGLNSFAGTVAVSASGLPTGVTASFSPASTTSTSVLTLTVATTAVAGSATITITGTSGSLTHTTTIALTITAATGGATQIISNPGFENGATTTPWVLTSGVICSTSSCSGQTPHTGSWYAWLDGYGSTHTDTANQQIVIPAGKTTATLSFFLHIDTAETSKTAANDTLSVQVLNTSGTVLGTLATYSNLNAATGYQQRTFNLAAYIGKTIVLKFTGKENSSKETSFVLDDITLSVQ
ncbi:S53 family serine peptidase [Granulicella sibirica]|uniref:Putative neutral zinc metalloprotease n=1 Tax=Granulicella sibirica TaxID=2479048 RepID=A0A4Q0T4C7_9BACT|nr:S53 family serine peptidase [Granulicella sibirica]RXH56888.1 putative neutral zinc metalloprotease [Granulicella sibirica]